MKRILISLVVAVLVVSCANRGNGPQGGLRDNTAPVFVSAFPSSGATRYDGKSIEIEFDEYVQLVNAQSAVTISPLQQRLPSYSASGRKVRVELNDTLKPNTTYSIDFSDAIRDINESNSLKNFHYTFSTGESLDTMEVSGRVVSASDLTPQYGVSVYLYEPEDSVLSQAPKYIARTDSSGRFVFRGLATGSYRICALSDKNGNYILDDGEPFAISTERIKTYFETESYDDTLRHHATEDPGVRREMRRSIKRNPRRAYALRDSMVTDTIVTRKRLHYYPDNVTLYLSKRDKKHQYLVKAERKQEQAVKFYMNDTAEVRPQIRLLGETSGRLLYHYSKENDTITCYIGDSSLIRKDSLHFVVSYMMTDTANLRKERSDTTVAYYRHVAKGKDNQAMNRAMQQYGLILPRKEIPVFEPLVVSCAVPLVSMDTSRVHLYSKTDSLWNEEPMPEMRCNPLYSPTGYSAAMSYEWPVEWETERVYRLQIDSAATTDIFGRTSKGGKMEFAIKGADHYSSLTVYVSGIVLSDCRLQLLDEKGEKVLRERSAETDGTLFEYLNPGEYRMRLYVDENRDGHWTPGDWKTRQQPETVYNFTGTIRLRANWDVDQQWKIVPRTPMSE